MENVSHVIIGWIIGLIAVYLARAVDRHSLSANLERLHTGASVEWAIGLREHRGRHALRISRTA